MSLATCKHFAWFTGFNVWLVLLLEEVLAGKTLENCKKINILLELHTEKFDVLCCVVRCEKCKGTFWIILISHHHPSVRYIITVLIFSCKGELKKVSPSTFVYQEASQTTSLRRNSIWIFQKVDKVDLASKEAGLEYWNTGYLPAMWDVALDFQTNLNVLLILDVVHVIMFLDCILD